MASRTTFSLHDKDLIVQCDPEIPKIVGLMIEIIYTSCLRLILITCFKMDIMKLLFVIIKK